MTCSRGIIILPVSVVKCELSVTSALNEGPSVFSHERTVSPAFLLMNPQLNVLFYIERAAHKIHDSENRIFLIQS